MREERAKIDLPTLGITGVKIKRAVTGALIFEVPGKKSSTLANKLAVNLRKALSTKEGVRVDRPTKMAELRLRGLEESITPREIAAAIARNGKCEAEEVKVGDNQMSPNGVSMAWVKCPLAAAYKIVDLEKNTDRVGHRDSPTVERETPPVLQMLGGGTRQGTLPEHC